MRVVFRITKQVDYTRFEYLQLSVLLGKKVSVLPVQLNARLSQI